MDGIDTSYVEKIWKTKGKDLIKPMVLFAVFNNSVYYVIRDNSFIIFIIPRNCNTTYAIPKKYTKLRKDNNTNYYKIKNFENASLVSCIGRKSPLEKLIIDNVIINPKC